MPGDGNPSSDATGLRHPRTSYYLLGWRRMLEQHTGSLWTAPCKSGRIHSLEKNTIDEMPALGINLQLMAKASTLKTAEPVKWQRESPPYFVCLALFASKAKI